jgi:hypothetical protein
VSREGGHASSVREEDHNKRMDASTPRDGEVGFGVGKLGQSKRAGLLYLQRIFLNIAIELVRRSKGERIKREERI